MAAYIFYAAVLIAGYSGILQWIFKEWGIDQPIARLGFLALIFAVHACIESQVGYEQVMSASASPTDQGTKT